MGPAHTTLPNLTSSLFLAVHIFTLKKFPSLYLADFSMATLLRDWDVLRECYESDGFDLSDAIRIGEEMIARYLYPLGDRNPGRRLSQNPGLGFSMTEIPAPSGKIVEIPLDEVEQDAV
jgi:hypothetical protein